MFRSSSKNQPPNGNELSCSFPKGSKVDVTRTHVCKSDMRNAGRELRTDRNQCSKPETSSGFNTVLIRTETWACLCQSYSHYSRLNKLKIQLCSICQIDVPCIPHPLLDSHHMCCTVVLPVLMNRIHKIQKKNVITCIAGRLWLFPELRTSSLFRWKAFSTIKAHLTLTLIKANR